MSPAPRLETITANLMVPDVDKTVAFYRDKLGFETVVTVPDQAPLEWAMLKRDDVVLMFQETGSLTGEYPVLKDRAPGGGLSLFVNVSNVDGLFAALRDTVEVLKEPHTTFYGMREFAILDCNGQVLTFAQRA